MPDKVPSADSRVSELLSLGAATVGETGARIMSPRVRAAWPGARACGPALSVRCAPGDNLAVHVAVAAAPAGCVLVVSVGDEEERGYWGEVLTTAAMARSVSGLVIGGGVRDVAALESHGFPVFSTMVALRGATKTGAGEVGTVVEVGGVSVSTGDWVVADGDGVAVVPRDSLEVVLDAARARAEKETRMFGELRSGRTTLELLAIDPSPVVVAEDLYGAG